MSKSVSLKSLSIVLGLFLTSCVGTSATNSSSIALKDIGLLSITRPLQHSIVLASKEELAPLGFLPTQIKPLDSGLTIDLKNQLIKVNFSGVTKEIKPLKINLDPTIKEGVIAHKQEVPLWYADNSYYSSRNLTIPGTSPSERLLRGVLGSQALFLDKDNGIYSSTLIDDSPAKGIILNAEDLKLLYDLLPVSTKVAVIN